MRLGIVMLDSSSSLNQLQYQNQTIINPGETATVYFQLVDLDRQKGDCPVRYIPSSAAQMSIQLTSLDIAKNITKVVTNPFPDDRSIWAFNLTSAETQYAAGVNMKATLTDGSAIKIAVANSVVIFGPRSPYSC